MTIESNISSTPARGLLANIGGIDNTSVALTTWNSVSHSPCFLPHFSLSGLSSCFDLFERISVSFAASVCLRFLVDITVDVHNSNNHDESWPNFIGIFPRSLVLVHGEQYKLLKSCIKYTKYTQASPKVLVQILITGTRILGKAFFEAGRQAVKSELSQNLSFPFHSQFTCRCEALTTGCFEQWCYWGRKCYYKFNDGPINTATSHDHRRSKLDSKR